MCVHIQIHMHACMFMFMYMYVNTSDFPGFHVNLTASIHVSNFNTNSSMPHKTMLTLFSHLPSHIHTLTCTCTHTCRLIPREQGRQKPHKHGY